jgi:hypothetical protein
MISTRRGASLWGCRRSCRSGKRRCLYCRWWLTVAQQIHKLERVQTSGARGGSSHCHPLLPLAPVACRGLRRPSC